MDGAKHRLITDWLPAGGIAIPFLLALAAQAVGPKASPVAAAAVRPALAFDQYLVDLGPVNPSEEVRVHFDFTNRGTENVTIDELLPSCGCLQPQLPKKEYKPGESGSFFVRVQTANENPGLKEYNIAVKYNDPEPRQAEVFFRVVLPDDEVLVRPRALAFYQLGSGGIKPQTIEITDRRGRHLNVTRVECSRDVVRVERQESQPDESGIWRERLSVAVADVLPPGRIEALIRIFTDDPEYRVLRVPLEIYNGTPRKIFDRHVQTTGGTN